ncbi:solute carrier family 22 member 1-like isoform X2 [Tenebrio molitor]|uniref:solute carrier family 22 member 1-like isoform X2 n=1 Tax=Tenebrio molitor TaxID=7067 RepID=UPI0036247CB6
MIIPVSQGSPPEELVTVVGGGCGRWQICITIVSFMVILIHGLDIYSSKAATPHFVNYTCADNSGSQCLNANGSKCENFVFWKQHDVTTFTEKFKLVCEKEHSGMWVRNCFCIGLMFGYVMSGWCADRFGKKIVAMICIPLQCILGVFLISITNYFTMLFFATMQGLCSASIYLIARVAVCEAVGNKWRTFVLGLTFLPLPISLAVSQFFYKMFNDIETVIAVISVLPLIFLVPLLYFKDSPHYILLFADFDKAEGAVRKIARFNKKHIPSDIRIRPVQIIENEIPPVHLCHLFLKSWFASEILLIYLYDDFENLYCFALGGVLGVIISTILCHFINHKIIIGMFNFLKCCSILGIFLLDVHLRETNNISGFVLKLTSSFFLFLSHGTLANLTPRMFSTDLRAQSLGFCWAVYYFGCVILTVIFTYSHRSILWGIVTVLIVISPLFETYSCFWLWNVHDRELPDILEDIINFEKFYKPRRFVTIHDRQVTPHEMEVKSVNLNDTE